MSKNQIQNRLFYIQWLLSLFLYVICTHSVYALVVNFSATPSSGLVPLFVTLSTRNQIVPSPGFVVSGYEWQLSGPETRALAGVAEQVVELKYDGTYTFTLIATEFAIQNGRQVTNTGRVTKTIIAGNGTNPLPPVVSGQVWQAPPEPDWRQGYIPIDRFRSDDANLWKNPLRLQSPGPFFDTAGSTQYDATNFAPEWFHHAVEGFFQIRYACQASWYTGAQDVPWIPANVIGAIEYCVYPDNVEEVVNYLRSTADRLACSAGLETCQ